MDPSTPTRTSPRFAPHPAYQRERQRRLQRLRALAERAEADEAAAPHDGLIARIRLIATVAIVVGLCLVVVGLVASSWWFGIAGLAVAAVAVSSLLATRSGA